MAVAVLDAIEEQDHIPVPHLKLDISDDSSVSSAEEESMSNQTSLIPKPHKKQLILTWGILRTSCLLALVLGGSGFFFYCLYLVIHFRVI